MAWFPPFPPPRVKQVFLGNRASPNPRTVYIQHVICFGKMQTVSSITFDKKEVFAGLPDFKLLGRYTEALFLYHVDYIMTRQSMMIVKP